ncbi:hypothetical protein TNCV_3277481 [Trichonephila clavipes]|nr:hypothetical protein TNCV_3277481 [Trichonephila clavipes]
MAERSKALRSGRSPLLLAWVPNTKCKETLSHVRMADRCKTLHLDHIPLLRAWVPNTKCKETLSHVRKADRCNALRLDHIPLLWAWDGQAVKGAAFMSKSTRFWRGHFLWLKDFMQGKAILRVRMAERSKALRSGRSPLLWAWDGQAVKGAAFMSKSTRFWRGFESHF